MYEIFKPEVCASCIVPKQWSESEMMTALTLDSRASCLFAGNYLFVGWLGSRVVSVLDSGINGPGFKSQSRRCWVTVLGKLFIPIVPLFTKQQNW